MRECGSNNTDGSGSLAVLLAGGRGRRFGGEKALARVGGVPIAVRTRDALGAAGLEVAVSGSETLAEALRLPFLPDLSPGLGPLAGLDAALGWAISRGSTGVLCVACDMPFLSTSLIRHTIALADGATTDVVIPESAGPRGVEPLCAWYSVRCAPIVSNRLGQGDFAMAHILSELSVTTISISQIRRYGDPDTLFLNVNTPADLDRAAELERAGSL
ncbi:MAG TPA: molybdenum cofactor guanylyltransferase [Longimicrobiaceae bacterium]|nr:molybdenum cofactor guanylyltransferase [Longimicrobiaceae bacterium]